MPVQVGTGYVDIQGDFSTLNKQVAAAIGPLTSRFGKLGTAGAVGLAGITAGAVAAAKGLYEIGEAFDDAYDKIRVQTGATGKELAKLEKNFRGVVKTVPTDFDSASTAISGLNQRLELTGKPLRKLTDQVLELSRITGTDVAENVEAATRLFGDWSIKTGEQSKVLDGLFRISQQTGASVSDLSRNLVQFGAPLRNLGLDLEFAAAMFANFEKTGVNITTVLSGLRLSVANLAAPTDELRTRLRDLGIDARDPEQALTDVFHAIETLDDRAGKTLGMEVFGRRAGSDLVDAVRTGRFELEDLISTFEKGDETIRRAGRSNMDLAEQWTLLKNNLATELEPTASRVFEEIGQAMGDVVDVITDKSLTRDEQFTKLLDMLNDAVADAAPAIAENAGKLGIAVVRGMLSGISESDTLGRLVIGGTLLKMMGGIGAFRREGAKAGGSFGSGFGAKMRTAGIGLGIAGAIYAAEPMIEDALTKVFGEDARDTIEDAVGIWEIPGLIDDVLNGPEAAGISFHSFFRGDVLGEFTEPLLETREQLRLTAQAARDDGNAITKAMVDTWVEAGDVTEDQADRMLNAIRHVNQQATLDDARQEALDFTRSLQDGGEVGGRELKQLGKEIEELRGKSKREYAAMTITQSREMREMGLISKKAFRDIVETVEDGMGQSKAAILKDSARGAGGLSHNFWQMAGSGLAAVDSLLSTTQAATDALEMTEVNLSIAKGGKAVEKVLDLVTRQSGGMVKVPGFGSGDTVPVHVGGALAAFVEPGELLGVVNREGAAVVEQINREVPRFAEGAVFPVRSYPGLSGDTDFNPALGAALSRMAQATHTPISVSEGGRTYAEQAAYYASYLAGTGNLAAAPGTGMHEFAQGAFAADISPDRATFGSVAGRYGLGFTVPSEPWHIELLNHAASGALGPAAQEIARVIITGPDGPLKDTAQAASDMVWRAAKDFVGKQVPVGAQVGPGAFAMGGSGTLTKSQLVALWSRVNSGLGDSNLMAAIALAESGGDVDVINSIGATGLWQVLQSAHPQYPVSQLTTAVGNAQAAGEILQSEGLGAWEAYTNGMYAQFLQRGGLLKMMQGGGFLTDEWKTVRGSNFGSYEGEIEGYKGDRLQEVPNAFAEHGMGTALGGLDYKQALDFLYKGKTATGYKYDIGDGLGRADVDIYLDTLGKALGITDQGWSGDVRVRLASGSPEDGGSIEYGHQGFKPGNGGPNEIARIIKQLKGDDLTKKGREAAEARLELLRKRKWKAEARKHERLRKRVRRSITDVAELQPYPSMIREALAASDLADERLTDLQNINSLTDLPDLPSDDELLGVGGSGLLDAYNVAVDAEATEISAEILKASDLLFKQVLERNTILSGLDAAQIHGDDLAGKERRTDKELGAVDALIHDEQRKKKPNEARLRNLRLQRKDLASRLRALRSGQGDITAFTREQSATLTELQGTDHDHRGISLEQITGGYLDQMPLGRFGGLILDTQATLKNLGKDFESMTGEKISMPKPDVDATDSDDELVDRSGFLASIQSPVFEQFFREALTSLPRHHDGGIIAGPIGSEQPIMGLGGERVLSLEEQRAMAQPVVHVTFVVEEGAGIDPSKLRAVVDDKVAEVVRASDPRTPTIGKRSALIRG